METIAQSAVVAVPAVCSRFSGLRIPASVAGRYSRSPRFTIDRSIPYLSIVKAATNLRGAAGVGLKSKGDLGAVVEDVDEEQARSRDESVQDMAGREDDRSDGVVDERHQEEVENTNSLPENEGLFSNCAPLEEMADVMESVSESFLSVLKLQKNMVLREGETPLDARIATGVNTGKVSAEENGVSFKRRKEVRQRRRLNEKGKAEVGKDMDDSNAIEDERFMTEALAEARKGAKAGEVPVGAVIVLNGKIISRAYNRVEAEGDPTAHAEMLCIRNAARYTGNWRLMEATMYVTLEPCPMCAGAILQSRVKEVVWGARNTLLGADGSWVSLFPDVADNEIVGDPSKAQRPLVHPFHTTLEVRRGVKADEASTVMRSFFRTQRNIKVAPMKKKPLWLPFSAWMLFKRLLQFRSLSGRSFM